MKDPACVIAITGDAGLGKSTVVAGVLSELGMTAWTVSAVLDDLGSVLALIQHHVRPNLVLVIDDVHALSHRVLDDVFDLLARDRAAIPRLVIVGRRPFWSVAERPAGSGTYECISAVAVLFALTDAEAEHYVRHTLDLVAPGGSSVAVRAAVQRSQGSPRALREATKSWARVTSAPTPRSAPIVKQGKQAVTGAVALIILVLAIVALTMSVVEPSSNLAPQSLVPRSVSDPRAVTLR